MSRSESGGARGSLGGGLGGLGALGGVRRGSSRPQDSIKGLKSWLSRNLLLLATLVGVLCGVLLGLSLRPLDLHDDWVLLLSYPGELFMRLLKLMILPLVIASLIAGTSRLNARMNGRIALRTLVYFALTSLLNAMLGIVLVLAIHPGDPLSFGEDGPPLDSRDTRDPRDRAQVMDGLLDLGRNLFADNLFQAAFQQVHTVYVPKEEPFSPTGPTAATTQAYPAVAALTASTASVEMKRALKYRDGTNTLGIIFFCLLFGTVLSTMGSKGKVVVDFFCTIYEVIMKMVSGIMWLTPVGVCSVICGKILAVDDLAVVMAQLAWFILTVVIGVLLYQLIIMQLIYYAFLRKNPFRFYANLFQSNLTAFATASTAAALPISMRTMDRLGVDPRVTRFVLPIGCAVNMDGTALFIAVATIFIAQMNYMTLGWGDLATVCLTATAASMSSASVPSAALVLLLMVLSTIGIPAGEASLLFAVDWFVDRVRTTNNCLGDLYAAAVVEHLSKAELESPDGEALNTAEFNGIGTFVEDGDADLEAAMEKGPSLHNGSIKK
ncbi:excitatory amino acid transporter-like [Thrips palmi]|uniref:Amino acid transporter n=1 Tax=Thrips palmi TaxID=161013 RepID=A0A6P8ZYF0_THRPL|nr:excitatory amino acid transporter-like [Thrips palmi]